MKRLRDQHAIFIRLTQHDGYALSVLEAVANGNYVIWNNPHPQVTFVEYTDKLVDEFAGVYEAVQKNQRARLTSNMEWAHQNLSKEKVLGLYKVLRTGQ
jgi:hypothetical protein